VDVYRLNRARPARQRIRGDLADADSPLTDSGRDDVGALRRILIAAKVAPEIYFTSLSRHARETAEILADGSARIVSLDALAPQRGKRGSLDSVLDEARMRCPELPLNRTIALVGHEPELGDILEAATGRASALLRNAQAVCLRGDHSAALGGHASVALKLPSMDPQYDQLRHKIQAKMEVSAVMGGFLVPALVLLLESRSGTALNAAAIVAVMRL
jgi:phosphohistidine phosphatase SixA